MSKAAARRELRELGAAINHHRREKCRVRKLLNGSGRKAPGCNGWLTRSEAARLIKAAWCARQLMGDNEDSGREVDADPLRGDMTADEMCAWDFLMVSSWRRDCCRQR